MNIWNRVIKALIVVLVAISGLAGPAGADAGEVLLDQKSQSWALEQDHFELAETIPVEASFADILAGRYEGAFVRPEKAVPKLEGNGKAIWGRLTLKNPESETASVRLLAKYPQLDRIDWFVLSDDGLVTQSAGGQFVAGDANTSVNRFPSVLLDVEGGAEKEIYFRIRSDTVIILPLQVFRAAMAARINGIELLVFGLLVGCLLTMAVLGFVSFLGLKRWSSLWFAVFCVCAAGGILMGAGIDKAYVWPDRTQDMLYLLFVFQGLSMAATALFVSVFVRAKTTAPQFNRLLHLHAGFALLTCFTTPLPMWLAAVGFLASMAIGPLVIFAGAIWLWRRGVKGAGLIVVSWIPNQLGAVWIFLRAMDVVPYTEVNHYALPVACTLTGIAFVWALHRQNTEAEHRANHDQLTGLPNRFGFEQAVSASSASAHRSVAVMQVDLDGFKGINDTHGHAAGDHVLQEVSARLRSVCQPVATPFRNGGDEFIVLCRDRTRQADVEHLAQQIIDAVSQPIAWRDQSLSVGASVGVAFPLDGRETIFSALEEADAALYKAKQAGKGRVVLADDARGTDADDPLAA